MMYAISDLPNTEAKMASWSDLPNEVIQAIVEALRFKVDDVRNFRMVCTQWWRSTLIPSYCPYKMRSIIQPTWLITSSISLLRHPDSPQAQLSPWLVLAVEFPKGTIKLFNPFSRTPLPNLPHNFDLSRFHSTQLANAYHVVIADDGTYNLSSRRSCPNVKVLMFWNQILSSIHNCTLLSLSDEGKVTKLCPFYKFPVRGKTYNSFGEVDDIVRYKGKTYALNKQGELYSFCNKTNGWHVCRILGDCFDPDGKGERRKRLALMASSFGDGKLYLVVPLKGHGRAPKGALKLDFKVFELKLLSNECNIMNFFVAWEGVTSFGDGEQVLCVCRHDCFFIPAVEFPECQLKNCIVFSDDAFPNYSKTGWNYEEKCGEKVAVFSFNERAPYSWPVEHYPDFPKMLFSPPPWALPYLSSPIQSQSQRCEYRPSSSGFERSPKCDGARQMHNETIRSAAVNDMECATEEDNCSNSFRCSARIDTTGSPIVSNVLEQVAEEAPIKNSRSLLMNKMEHVAEETTRSRTVMNGVEHNLEEGPDFLKEKVSGFANSTPVAPTALKENGAFCSLTVNFEGVEINSELLPTLQAIWATHGSLIGKETVRSKPMLACALESLAKLMITLQNTTGRSLTDALVDDISSTFFDLQRAGLKVDWLLPAIEKALNFHKSKPLIEYIILLNERKAQIDKVEQEFLACATKVKQEIEKGMACLSAKIPYPAELRNLDDYLGTGLL